MSKLLDISQAIFISKFTYVFNLFNFTVAKQGPITQADKPSAAAAAATSSAPPLQTSPRGVQGLLPNPSSLLGNPPPQGRHRLEISICLSVCLSVSLSLCVPC